MINTADLIYQKSQLMPENLQIEALHYIEYLLEIEQERKSKHLYDLMTEMATRPNTFSQPGAMEEWEESRKDKVLFGREE